VCLRFASLHYIHQLDHHQQYLVSIYYLSIEIHTLIHKCNAVWREEKRAMIKIVGRVGSKVTINKYEFEIIIIKNNNIIIKTLTINIRINETLFKIIF
jgi:hypothetical protein